MRPDRMKDPAKAMQERLYELEWPEVDQQGVASWYGPGFHGRKTANGERFNQYELTAAHPTYEFGTQLCVRSKSTGQTVVVRVNDRGPFVKNRVIDLSKAAAEEIGMLGKGVKSVEIYKLDEGEDSCPEAVLAASN
nr:septal ring lytic transglycosylase RlpA family protein [Comamonas jiangduensis]